MFHRASQSSTLQSSIPCAYDVGDGDCQLKIPIVRHVSSFPVCSRAEGRSPIAGGCTCTQVQEKTFRCLKRLTQRGRHRRYR